MSSLWGSGNVHFKKWPESMVRQSSFLKDEAKSKWLSWVSKGLLWEAVNKLSPIYKASPVFTSLYKSSCFSKSSACFLGNTTQRWQHMYSFGYIGPFTSFLPAHVPAYSQASPPTLLCLEAPWPFVLIEHLDHSGEGTGVGVKKQAHVWMMVLLLGG